MPPHSRDISQEKTESIIGNQDYKLLSAYDELRPKNEPRFIRKIRDIEKSMGFLTPLRWPNVTYFFLTHVILLSWMAHNLYMGKFAPKWQTWIHMFTSFGMGSFGVNAGIHRYWTHRSFKANEPLRWILFFCYTLSGEVSIFEWARDHRVHHKFSETIADPYDSNRGFFFAHMGWLMMKRHPAVLREGRKLDLADLTNDPLVQFHTKYFILLKLLIAFALPIIIPPLFWDESWETIILGHLFLSVLIGQHIVFSVNSFAHMYGNKPYDPNIKPAENALVSLVTLGEGWHNYHHTFPWDYKNAELPYFINPTTAVIDFFAAIGWARDMKKASPEIIKNVIRNRTPGNK